MTSIEQLIQELVATKGDPRAQAAITAEFFVTQRPESERDLLRAALDAAAVLHFFDTGLIARLLEISVEEASAPVEVLKNAPFVEAYISRERELYDVHESTRLGWRKRLESRDPERFRTLSIRAAQCLMGDHSARGTIEWVYQLLCGDPNSGAAELEKLNREWTSARPEESHAMSSALGELHESGQLRDRALLWALVFISWTDVDRGKDDQIDEAAVDILNLARSIGERTAEAQAQCLLGDVLETQGKPKEAQAAFSENLRIMLELVEQDHANVGRQRDLAVAHSRLGDVLLTQGKLDEALTAFTEALQISRRLDEQEPNNANWMRRLAVAHIKLGDIWQALQMMDKARAEYEEGVQIMRQLAAQDPDNAGWHRDLARARGRLGAMLVAQADLSDAHAAFAEYVQIIARLSAEDPDNADLQHDLAVAHSWLGNVLEALGQAADAAAEYAEFARIGRRLVEQYPGNAVWRQDFTSVLEPPAAAPEPPQQ